MSCGESLRKDNVKVWECRKERVAKLGTRGCLTSVINFSVWLIIKMLWLCSILDGRSCAWRFLQFTEGVFLQPFLLENICVILLVYPGHDKSI